MFLLELPHRVDSNENTQYTISNIKKENHPKLSRICSYLMFTKGLTNEFETAVVNEPSVFEPVKFCCILNISLVCTNRYINLLQVRRERIKVRTG